MKSCSPGALREAGRGRGVEETPNGSSGRGDTRREAVSRLHPLHRTLPAANPLGPPSPVCGGDGLVAGPQPPPPGAGGDAAALCAAGPDGGGWWLRDWLGRMREAERPLSGRQRGREGVGFLVPVRACVGRLGRVPFGVVFGFSICAEQVACWVALWAPQLAASFSGLDCRRWAAFTFHSLSCC